MGSPTISACIGVYNGAEHVAQAIQSVQAQSVKVDEILVVDDGSKDDSAKIAASFEGVRVITQLNGGIGAARKALVENAIGEWIAFCDHDDWWEPNRIEAQLPFTSDPEVNLIYSPVWHVDENGIETECPTFASPEAETIDHLVPQPESIWTSATLLRRNAILQVGNFNPTFRTGEDMLMWFQLGSIGKIVQVPIRLVHMTRRAGSTSAASRMQFEYAVALYDKQVLPHFDEWFSWLPEDRRSHYKCQLEAKMGYTMSILANYWHREGDRKTALDLFRRASRLAPRSKGVWYRYLRSLAGLPGRPPI